MSMIGDAFDSYMDWTMSGSMPWSLTKLFASAALAVSLIASPFVYVGYQNSVAMQKRIEMLDKSPTQIFNSVAQCVEKGHDQAACEASQKEAISIANGLGTSVEYDSQSQCIANHATCDSVTVPITTYVSGGNNVMIPITNYVTTYHPAVKAWQAAQDDLTQAVPLYQSAQHNMVVRADGAQFPAP